MARSLHKMWRNGPGGRWDCRIRWYGEGKDRDQNIRLNLEDPGGSVNLYPPSKEEADHMWFQFRHGAPDYPGPFISDLCALMATKYSWAKDPRD